MRADGGARTVAMLVRSGVMLGIWALVALWPGGAQAGCAGAGAPCETDAGTYHLELPPGTDDATGVPALMFLHGWGGSGAGTLRLRGVVDAALARGYAVIAPDGTPRAQGNGRSWGFHPDRPGPRDEIAFLQSVRDDAATRHGIDAARVLLSGFSIGGSMTSYLACAEPAAFAAYAPVAGAFWVPVPATCAGPVELFHTHGWTDTVVPLEGRVLGGGEDPEGQTVFAQADVWQTMQVWRAANGCRPNTSGHGQVGPFWRRSWHDCDSGARLDFALFHGGHEVPEGWVDMALDWVEAR